MWIAHFASGEQGRLNTHFISLTDVWVGLIAKPFAPRVPLLVLTLAGAFPDALFFVLQMLGIESFNLDAKITQSGGCFPYTNDYPFSHSLAGMVASGGSLSSSELLPTIFTATQKASCSPSSTRQSPASPRPRRTWPRSSQRPQATSYSNGPPTDTVRPLSLLPLTPAHPASPVDTTITPGGSTAVGAGLFDYPAAVFVAENAIFFCGLWVYLAFAPPASKAGLQQSPGLLKIVAGVMAAQQAQFCFTSWVSWHV